MFTKKYAALFLGFALVLSSLLIGCSSTPTATPTPTNDDTTTANTTTVKSVAISPDAPTVSVSSTQQFTAVARDSNNNTLTSVAFTWSSSNTAVGTISTSGLATGVSSGTTLITVTATGTAYSDTTTMTVSSSQVTTPASVALVSALPNIQVAGAGGISFTAITATVKDGTGQMVSNGTPITFRITANPGGATLNNVYTTLTTTTSLGQAIVTLNSGTSAGPIQVSAFCVAGNDTIRSQINLVIISGPTSYLTLATGTPTDNSDGTSNIPITALLQDKYTNPVSDGTTVYYQVWIDAACTTPVIGANITDAIVTGGTGKASATLTWITWLAQPAFITAVTTGADAAGNVVAVSDTITYTLYK
ncbi:Ig-like domain-containing protein [candidate division TA06 bacterium]|nr:Ig-like domain-containing protein [candidate division TA06 bacterium]